MTTLVANLVEAYRRNIDALDWMSAETKVRARGEAGAVHAQDRLPRPVARLLRPAGGPRRPARQRPGRRGVRDRPRAGQARRPGRPHRVAHDAADGQRLLQPGDERDRLPRRRSCSRRSSTSRPTTPSTTARSARSSATRSVTGSTTRARGTTATGNLSDWWTEQDRERFDALTQAAHRPVRRASSRATCPASTSTAPSPSARTSATSAASRSPTRPSGSRCDDEEPPELDGLTGAQRFFVGWAHVLAGQGPRGGGRRRLSRRPALPAGVPRQRRAQPRGVPRGVRRQGGRRAWLAPEARVRIW